MAMLERILAQNGVVFYRSALLANLGVSHGFSTRIGGISQPPFDSLNLGNPNGCAVQDPSGNIPENYRLLHEAIGCAGRERLFVHQVHGGEIRLGERNKSFDCSAKADAIVTDDPSRVAAVRVADCVPVLLATADGHVVAAVHAGWRGVVGGVVLNAIAEMRKLKPAAAIVAAIGPAIGPDAFEVGPEVIVEFHQAFGALAAGLMKPSPNAGKTLVNLGKGLELQLRGAGLSAELIDRTDRCTFRDADEFFSHRRENGVTGRMAALIGPT